MNTHLQTTKKLLDRHFHRSKQTKLAIGIYAKNETFFSSLSDKEEDLRDVLFGLGSISKTFIGAYIAKLLDEDKLQLTDRLDHFFKLNHKGFLYPTVEQLLTHTSGYTFFIPRFKTLSSLLLYGFNKRNVYTRINDAWVLKYVNNHKPLKTHKYRYSDFNYALLSKIIEHITKKNIREVIHAYITSELALKQTLLKTYEETHADPYSWHFENDNPFVPAGAMFSTVSDMICFMKHHIYHHNYMAHVYQKYHQTSHRDIYTGFSWNAFKNGHFYWHIGGQGYYRSYVLFDTKREIAVVILATVSIDLIHIGRLGSSIYRNTKRNYGGIQELLTTYTKP